MAILQVRRLPDETHRILKSRAARSGRSLSDYVAGLLNTAARQPTLEEFFDRVHAHGDVDPGESAADALARERAGRP
ncbi:MAG: hypothetical protein LBG11_05795 [Bifidobacteriaceae bacterium]|jgi:plasmid stability protein|nr:hypothetical protein [Bifidobacteriaceae bacterium]